MGVVRLVAVVAAVTAVALQHQICTASSDLILESGYYC